jgi:hypothetical protein
MARKPCFEPGRRPSGHHIPVKKAIRAFRGRGATGYEALRKVGLLRILRSVRGCMTPWVAAPLTPRSSGCESAVAAAARTEYCKSASESSWVEVALRQWLRA